MQAALCFAAPAILPLPKTQAKSVLASPSPTFRIASISLPRCRATATATATASAVPDGSSTVDYSSVTSVFPAEACETIGGDACNADMYPEVKLPQQLSNPQQPTTAQETLEREYLDYTDPKTVFIGEACDDLGGEFCDPEYQRGELTP